MLNFEDEIKKFQPSLEVEDIEGAVYQEDLTDMTDIIREVMDYAELAIAKGNPNAVTDGKTALMLARTAVLAAGYNVKINLDSIKDEEYVWHCFENSIKNYRVPMVPCFFI